MGIFKHKEKSKTAEEMEEKKECNFELYDENDGKFYCSVSTASIVCNKSKCPFWKQ
jgi:hypothetical protein